MSSYISRFFFVSDSFTGSPQNQSPTEWSKTPAPAHREKAPSTNTQEKRIVSASVVRQIRLLKKICIQFGSVSCYSSLNSFIIKRYMTFPSALANVRVVCLLVTSVLERREIPATIGRSRPMRWFCSPGSAQGLLAQFTKGSGTVRALSHL